MTYALTGIAHALAAAALGVALVGVWFADERARHAPDLARFVRARRRAAWFEQRLLRPAVVMLLATGTWLVVQFHGASSIARVPWLAGMVTLFVSQSAWAITVTRPHAARLDRLVVEALETGTSTPALAAARAEATAAFWHFAEFPLYLLIVALGLLRPATWTPVVAGTVVVLLAAALAARAPRLRYATAPSSFASASVDGEGRSPRVAPSTSWQRR